MHVRRHKSSRYLIRQRLYSKFVVNIFVQGISDLTTVLQTIVNHRFFSRRLRNRPPEAE
jgi:hypothetical protein